MTHSLRPRLLLFALLLVVLPGCLPEAAAEDGAEADAPTVRITAVTEEAGLAVRRFVGRTEAVSTVDLAFQLSGQIVDLPVRHGEVVRAGEMLAALDPSDYELALARAEATLALAEAEHARARDLAERGAAPEARQDRALADLRLAEVERDVAERNLALARITLPFDALVTRRLLDRFAYVAPGDPVIRVQDVTEMRVRISVPEDLIGLARQPDTFEAFARLAAYPDIVVPLSLREFVTETDSLTQTYEVSFAIDGDRDARILPGMTVTVEVRANGAAALPAVTVPLGAVDATGADGFQVWVYDRDAETVAPRTISVGVPQGENVPVLDGLEPGEEVVAAGTQHLAPGLRVRALGL